MQMWIFSFIFYDAYLGTIIWVVVLVLNMEWLHIYRYDVCSMNFFGGFTSCQSLSFSPLQHYCPHPLFFFGMSLACSSLQNGFSRSPLLSNNWACSKASCTQVGFSTTISLCYIVTILHCLFVFTHLTSSIVLCLVPFHNHIWNLKGSLTHVGICIHSCPNSTFQSILIYNYMCLNMHFFHLVTTLYFLNFFYHGNVHVGNVSQVAITILSYTFAPMYLYTYRYIHM